ncbi:MAG: MFS transporter [Calditrichales bacterium]|nr:MAG: MFS transporter [Calditrichales bacterium]
MKKFFQFKNNRSVYSWALYDWANSAFATTVIAAVLPVYYGKIAESSLAPNVASSYWAYGTTVAMLLLVFMAPILGAIADYKRAKLKFLGGFVFIGVVFTAMLFFVREGDWLMAILFYVLSRIGWSGANVFYDSLLPHISESDEIDRVSTLGYAAGYMGGGILLGLNLGMILSPETFGIPDSGTGTRLSLLSVACWWALFSIPLFKNVPEPVSEETRLLEGKTIPVAFKRIGTTFRDIKKFKQAFLFMIAFWLYNDGIGTIIAMAVMFGIEIGIGQAHLIGAILAVQLIGIPFTILFGKLAEKTSVKRAIYFGLIVYTFISIGGYFMQTAIHFWILAVVVGMVQGGTQALSRSLFGLMTPKRKSSEFFGLFDVSQKFSGILGPAIFGLVAQLAGSSRLSIIALVVFFIGGMFILEKVRLDEGIAAAQAADGASGLSE